MVKQLSARLGNHAHDLLFKTIHQRYLIYNMCWEDPRIDRQLLGLDQHSKVVVLTSAGCNALDYLLDAPAEDSRGRCQSPAERLAAAQAGADRPG
jgi:S-adenosylmethionine-diacylglycerol 3-amino-3-carboxypropyl transferase